jgi:serine/threonine protein kinase
MNPPNICPTCGKALPADAPMGVCPDCLLKAGFGTMTDDQAGNRPAFQPPSNEELAPYFPELEIIELLGRGGMGAVYKARQKRLDRVVALKILPPGIGQGPAFAERFEREAKALARLHHPHIVTLYEFGQRIRAGEEFR